MRTINFGVKAGNSIGFVEVFGMKRDTILTSGQGKDGIEKIEIDWDDRFDEKVLAGVASYRKHFVNIDSTPQEILTEYDLAKYIRDNVTAGMKIVVTGRVEKQPYTTKAGENVFMDKYIVDKVMLPKDDDKVGLHMEMELFFNADCVDDADLKSENKVVVDGWVSQYISGSVNNQKMLETTGDHFYIPQKVVLSAPKLDMSNPKHKALFKYRTDELLGFKSNLMYHSLWECKLVSGPEEVEFTEDMLTKKQKMQIEMGEKTLEDFKPRGGMFGASTREVRLIRPVYLGDFEDGTVEADETLAEFEENIAKFNITESINDIVNDALDDVPFDVDSDDDDDDAFFS